ncbi:MAG: AAC(3) family N-acetyltransferase [Chloroflexi bacterium]|jgi:aminoglycoside N3'-acetyltransferase|nr:AAC(3) family N-acetyltransferase [Chloroflexota bacterium]
MNEVTQQQISALLRELGIGPGDRLIVHSAVQFLGRPVGGAGIYLQALLSVLNGEPGANEQLVQGALAVPTFNFGFARGEPYDPEVTPSEGMGVFSELVRRHPGARRSMHPMQSLAVLGPDAADITGRDTPSAFDPGSAFERLLDLDFKLLLLGASVQAVSIIHYSEQRARVPYRYWKEFTGQVKTPAGWQQRTYRMFVRDLEINPQLDLRPVQQALQASGKWEMRPLNYGRVCTCRLRDFVDAADRLLEKDPWALVGSRSVPHTAHKESKAQLE